MTFDLRTLILADALVSFVLMAARCGLPAARSSAAWAAGLALVALAKTAFVLRDVLAADAHLTLVNALLLGGYLAFAQAASSLAGQRPLPPAALVGVAVAMPALFAALPATAALRALRLAAYTAVVVALLALMIARLQQGPARLRGARIVQGALALHALAIALRAAYGLVHAPPDAMQPFAGQSAVFLSSMPVVVAATLGWLMMLHDLARGQLEQLARHDSLTGLLNRRGWIERLAAELARARRTGQPACVLALDIDHFKAINDRFGHAAGDRVLAEVARCIGAALPAGAAAGRLGGEEFAVLLGGHDSQAAHAVAVAIQHALRAGGREASAQTVSVSIGVALASEPEAGYDIDRLLRAADVRLYEAKRTRDAIVGPGGLPQAPGHAAVDPRPPAPVFRQRPRG